MKALETFKKEFKNALDHSQREEGSVHFLVASKYFSADEILEFYQEGIRDFGENRVQEALQKMELLPKDIRWHFLGHIQSKKIPKIKDHFFLIHSIDSFDIAQKLSKALTHSQDILIQIKTTNEPSKTGFTLEDFKKAYPKIQALDYLNIKGLMTMAPKEGGEKEARRSFQILSKLKEEFQENWELSMGMSQDYPIAIQEGATWLRIGRVLKKESSV